LIAPHPNPWISSPSDDATFSFGKSILVLLAFSCLRKPIQRPRGTEVISQLDNGPLIVIATHSFPQIPAHPATVPTDGFVPGRHTLKLGLLYVDGAIDWMDCRNIILTRSLSNANSLAEDPRPDLRVSNRYLGTLSLNQLSSARIRIEVIWHGAGAIRIDFERIGFGNHWKTLWENVLVNEVFERALGPNFIAEEEFKKPVVINSDFEQFLKTVQFQIMDICSPLNLHWNFQELLKSNFILQLMDLVIFVSKTFQIKWPLFISEIVIPI
jgi:hypothetical protein